MDAARARVFGTAAEAYEQGRPDYRAEHVAWLVDGVRGTILDLGAGSGKLTRVIARLGFPVIAVDPDERMLAHNTTVETHVGTAESIPLRDHSVAAVTVGQAWHWFDQHAAAAEIRRVLVPGGRLALVWNDYDTRDPFTASLFTVIEPVAHPESADEPPTAADGFPPFEQAEFSWRARVNPERLEALVRSRSGFLMGDPGEQQRTLAAVRELVRAAAGPDDTLEIAYRTHCYRADAL